MENSDNSSIKLLCCAVDERKNGVDIIFIEKVIKSELRVIKVSDRLDSIKIEEEGMMSIASGYALHVECDLINNFGVN